MRSAGFVVLISCLASLGCGEGGRGGEQPDVLLISVDTLRADHLGAYGYDKPTSPILDRFAEHSLLFERCQAHAPNTRPSVASLLTGFLPHETRVMHGGPLPDELDTLAEILKERGYVTRAVVSNWVLRIKSGMDQGFDAYDARMQEREKNRKTWPERTAAHTTDAAIEMLDQPRDGPLFLWVHYQDPHGPYAPPDGSDREFRDDRPPRPLPVNAGLSGIGGIPSYQVLGPVRDHYDYIAAYDAEIRYFDEHLGRFLDALGERGLLEESLIVFTADHGEALGERNFFFNHVGYLYGTLTHVPMLLRWGDRLSGRRRDPCQLIDVVPTVISALGIDRDPRLRGRDLLDEDSGAFPAYAVTRPGMEDDGYKVSLVEDGFRLIHNQQSERVELFDMTSDPAELHDISEDAAHAARRDAMLDRLAEIRDDDRTMLGPGKKDELSEDDRRKLESLGYVE